ncbi:MAG: NAD(P)-binding domain-containing protein [Candidatus Binataceae bacterium]|jgi:thioredoxin reductase
MRRRGFIAVAIALAALILARHKSYQPGELMAAHNNLRGQCAACHQPWHGPANDRCIACHGDITDVNPHGGYDVTSDTGLIAGHKLFVVGRDSELTCMSCHTEHRGSVVDLNTTATFNCEWCHKHPSIGEVEEHTPAVMKRGATVAGAFVQPFNHFEHKLLIESHVPAMPEVFKCDSCHVVPATLPLKPERMSFRWTSCAGAGCHVAPQDSFMQLPAALGPAPELIAYAPKFLHLNAVFTHSAGHLATPCESCHFAMATSRSPNDAASKQVENCFKCHAHQIAPAAPAIHHAQAGSGWPRTGTAYAAATDRSANTVTACGGCHPLHIHGPLQKSDFPQPAPQALPHGTPQMTFTLYLPAWGGVHGVAIRPVQILPWLLGWLGLVAAGLCFSGLVWFLPSKAAEREVVAGVASQRTQEIPLIDDTYQTSVRHLYIIGEASGTASINLAMRSGRQVIEAIAAELKRSRLPLDPGVYEVVIVGCGPAGLGATATARAAGLNYVTLEKMTPASTLRAYPRAKFVQATPIDIAEYGSFFLEGDNSREELIQEWERIIATLGLTINDREEVVEVTREGELLIVKTASGNAYKARTVVLAIGVRGNARHLNLPGEEPGRVFYTLIEPGEFQNRKIMVVGGGNAGTEVAQALAAAALGNQVSYSFRAPVLTNVTRENAEKISALQQAKLLTLYPSTALKEIKPGTVVLEPVKNSGADSTASRVTPDGPIEVENDIIFAMIGAELPTAFLKKMGVKMGSKGRVGLS